MTTEKIATVIQNRKGIYFEPNQTEPFTGKVVIFYHQNGQKRAEINCKNGIKNGLVTTWWGNGQKESEANYKDGYRNGRATIWFQNGEIKFDEFYKKRQIIGSVFIQNDEVGLASYHFHSTDYVYINYENAPYWKLDNNKKFPEEKKFIDTSFDFEKRIFRGTIDWSRPEMTTVGGARKWIYEMKFNENYTKIVGGSVTSVGNDEKIKGVHKYEKDLFYKVYDDLDSKFKTLEEELFA